MHDNYMYNQEYIRDKSVQLRILAVNDICRNDVVKHNAWTW